MNSTCCFLLLLLLLMLLRLKTPRYKWSIYFPFVASL